MTFQRLFQRLLSLMITMNPNNGNETNSDIFRWDIFKFDTISFFNRKILTYFNESIFQFHCKSERKQVKSNEIKQYMCKSDSIFPH